MGGGRRGRDGQNGPGKGAGRGFTTRKVYFNIQTTVYTVYTGMVSDGVL